MGLYGSLSMGLYGVSLGHSGSLWVPVCLYGTLWVSMRSLWVAVGLYGISMGFYGFSMGPLWDLYGSL